MYLEASPLTRALCDGGFVSLSIHNCSCFFRDNAWSIQPRSGSDHPRVCLPGSDGGPVFFCGPTDESKEQAEAQEAQSEEAHVPAAAAVDSREKPRGLRVPRTQAPLLLQGLVLNKQPWGLNRVCRSDCADDCVHTQT